MSGRTLTRADLSEAVYQKVGLSRTESAQLVEFFLAEVSDSIANGQTVKLSSFGSFVVRDKGRRVGRNPKTGVEVPIEPRRVMVFKPSNVLKARVNGETVDDEAELIRGLDEVAMSDKAPDAYRTISEVAEALDLPQHVLRFWETRFPQIKPLKRGGGRRYYRPDDVALLLGIRSLLYGQGYTIKGVQRILREQGAKAILVAHASGVPLAQPVSDMADDPAQDGVPVMSAVPVADDRRPARPAAPATVPAIAEGWQLRMETALAELRECRRLLESARGV